MYNRTKGIHAITIPPRNESLVKQVIMSRRPEDNPPYPNNFLYLVDLPIDKCLIFYSKEVRPLNSKWNNL